MNGFLSPRVEERKLSSAVRGVSFGPTTLADWPYPLILGPSSSAPEQMPQSREGLCPQKRLIQAGSQQICSWAPQPGHNPNIHPTQIPMVKQIRKGRCTHKTEYYRTTKKHKLATYPPSGCVSWIGCYAKEHTHVPVT